MLRECGITDQGSGDRNIFGIGKWGDLKIKDWLVDISWDFWIQGFRDLGI